MSLILNIDTSTNAAGICLCKEGKKILIMENSDQKDHAAWIQLAIENLMQNTGYAMKELKAIAVTEGPGSYTGLRVGMATAKGLCYALQIPLITENTLMVMAFAAREQTNDNSFLFCPMIDARRMEVFTALYNNNLEEIISPTAMVLDEKSFAEHLLFGNKILFFGNGSKKWQAISSFANAFFTEIPLLTEFLGKLSFKKFNNSQFTDIIYSEPVYTKEFYTHTKK